MQPSDTLREVQRLVHSVLAPYEVDVYLFGSWARGTTTRTSDIDIGVYPRQPLPVGVLPTLREQLEESHIPYRVEVVDLTATDDTFRQAVMREGIRWNDSSNS